MPTHNTKWFQSDFAGAPTCTGQAGSLITLLNAVLVDGFNSLTLNSLVVASNVATGTKASHGYKLHQIIEIAGATPAGLNGQWRVTSVSTDTFTFTTSGISDQTATGTITAKTPGCGWEKSFTGTNVAIYRPTSAQACGNHSVRVTDTGTTTATCVAAEDWTDVNTPVNSITTFYVSKSATADGTARGWTIVADDRTLYLAISWSGGMRDVLHWGDFKSLVAGDGAAFQVRAPNVAQVATLGYRSTLGYAAIDQAGDLPYGIGARGYSQVVGTVQLRQASMAGALYVPYAETIASYSVADTSGGVKPFNFSASKGMHDVSNNIIYSSNYGLYAAPNPGDGGLHFVPVFLWEGVTSSRVLRGSARGLLHILENYPTASNVLIYEGVDGVDDGLVMVVKTLNESFGYAAGARIYPLTHIAFDLGNWA